MISTFTLVIQHAASNVRALSVLMLEAAVFCQCPRTPNPAPEVTDRSPPASSCCVFLAVFQAVLCLLFIDILISGFIC